MATFSDQMVEWIRAYGLLGVEHEATVHAIKSAYRKMMKRWHPDLYPSGSPKHDEAAQMTIAINAAYAAIAQAPLRYRRDTQSYNTLPTTVVAYSVFLQTRVELERPRRPDRVEFWVRFVCGALFGTLLWIWAFLSHWTSSTGGVTVLLIGASVSVLFGFGAARFGDQFWYGVLRPYEYRNFF